MYTVYGVGISQHSRRVVSLLEEANIDYELKNVDMMGGEHMSPEYLEINPNHQVPTLLGDGIKIHESNAILRYLCNKHALDSWYPLDPERRAVIDQWLDWNQCRLSPAVVAIVLNAVFMDGNGDVEAIKRGREQVAELFPILEQALLNSDFIGGDQPTIADLAVVSNIHQLSLANEVPAGENTQRWYQVMLELEGVKRSIASL